MARYLTRRLATTLLTLFGVVVVVFCVVRVLPGDPAAMQAGPYASKARIAEIREQLGLDRPLSEQFIDYLGGVVTGDLGMSVQTGGPVARELMARLPASLELGLYAVVLSCLIGVPLGVLAAARQRTAVDHVARTAAIIGSSMALFWLGLLLSYFLFYRLGWFPPPLGRLAPGIPPPPHITGFMTIDSIITGRFALATQAFYSLALPVLTLTVVLVAPILKMVRQAMIETLDQDHVRTAKAMGIPRREVLLRDGLRNALLPIVTAIGIVFGYMLGGNILVETIFSWPGVGQYAYNAIQNSDLNALQGFVILVGFMYVMLNLLIDLVYAWVDPRIRLGQKAAT